MAEIRVVAIGLTILNLPMREGVDTLDGTYLTILDIQTFDLGDA